MTGDTRLGPIHQLARTVTDIAEAQRWYGEVLGLPLLFAFQGMAFFDCGGVRLYLSEAKTAAPESILYFKVADVRSAHADLAARGVSSSPPRRTWSTAIRTVPRSGWRRSMIPTADRWRSWRR